MNCERCNGPVKEVQLESGQKAWQIICDTCWIPGTPDPEQVAVDEYAESQGA